MNLTTNSDVLAYLKDHEEWLSAQINNSRETSEFREFHRDSRSSTRSLILFYQGRDFTPTKPNTNHESNS